MLISLICTLIAGQVYLFMLLLDYNKHDRAFRAALVFLLETAFFLGLVGLQTVAHSLLKMLG
jgi:hypothetical protein